ncbi:MAG: 30S ribosomal protein S17 [bacterium]|nr:30S ribosomal protein S17 [bacterium]
MNNAKKPKILSGTVVSDKMKDTIVVSVESYHKHPKYGKFVGSRKKFKAHDAGNTAKIGDKVAIAETRPISKGKHFKLIENSKLKIEN